MLENGRDNHVGDPIDPRVLLAKFGDRKIEAVQYVRAQTGLGLKEAKDIVDAAYGAAPEQSRNGQKRAAEIDPKTLFQRFGDRKVLAIRYVQEQTGLGLKEAKDIVDAAYGGGVVENRAGPSRVSEIDPRELLAKFGDRKIEAIRYVREQTGLGLKEAKDIVEAAFSQTSPVSYQRKISGICKAEKEKNYAGPEMEEKPKRWPLIALGLASIVIIAFAFYLLMQ